MFSARPVRIATLLLAALTALIMTFVVVPTYAVTSRSAVFPVAPHDDVTIEWWYLNAHVTTKSGRHLAIIGSFFRFGTAAGTIAMDSKLKAPQSHYLIYAITDEDTGAHRSYATADTNTLNMLRQALMLKVMMSPGDTRARALFDEIGEGRLPEPTTLFGTRAVIAGSPFQVVYGSDSVRAVPGQTNAYVLRLGSGQYRCNLMYRGSRPPMYVGGDGNTGLVKPDDMKYVSLTRCAVSGSIADGKGIEKVASGIGWFDHQWGYTWTGQTAGWDWWGVQLDDGRDILFFRQRNLSTGTPFFPLATVEDKNGNLTVTKNITFDSDPNSVWTSPRTGTPYPLKWTVHFPDLGTTLSITPVAKDQEMPVLASGGAIWEGSVKVTATGDNGRKVSGVGYQELVGYRPAFPQAVTPPARGVTRSAGVGPNSPGAKESIP